MVYKRVTIYLLVLAAACSCASAAVDWADLTATALASVDPQEFSNATAGDISSIPPLACTGLTRDQMKMINPIACSGFTADQGRNIQSAPFYEITPDCVESSTAQFWSMLSRAQMGALQTNTFAISAFSPEQWAQIPGAALADFDAMAGQFLTDVVCKSFTPEQIGNISAQFWFGRTAKTERCTSLIPAASWARLGQNQMSILSNSGYLKYICPAGVPFIPAEAFEGLFGNIAPICLAMTAAQIVQTPPMSFQNIFPSCANMSDDVWLALPPFAIAQFQPADWSQITWPRVALLSSASVARITPNMWNFVGISSMRPDGMSTMMDLSAGRLVELAQRVSATSNALFHTDSQRSPDSIKVAPEYIMEVKDYVYKHEESANVSFPEDNDAAWAGWTWMHFAFLEERSIPQTGMTDFQIQSLRGKFTPLRGVRPGASVALLDSGSAIAALDRNMTLDILIDTFESFSAGIMNGLRFLDALPTGNWSVLPGTVLRGISWPTWTRAPAIVIPTLTCHSVASLDGGMIYENAKACEFTCETSVLFHARYSSCRLKWGGGGGNAPGDNNDNDDDGSGFPVAAKVVVSLLPSIAVMVIFTIVGLCMGKKSEDELPLLE